MTFNQPILGHTITWTRAHPSGRLDRFCFDMNSNILYEIDNFAIDFNRDHNVDSIYFEYAKGDEFDEYWFIYQGRQYKYVPQEVFLLLKDKQVEMKMNKQEEFRTFYWKDFDSCDMEAHSFRYDLYLSKLSKYTYDINDDGEWILDESKTVKICLKDYKDKGYTLDDFDDEDPRDIYISCKEGETIFSSYTTPLPIAKHIRDFMTDSSQKEDGDE